MPRSSRYSTVPVMRIRKDGSEGLSPGPTRPVEHLGLEFAELVLEVGELVGQGLDDGGVPGAHPRVLRGPQVLSQSAYFY
jgi:hypothetical protein